MIISLITHAYTCAQRYVIGALIHTDGGITEARLVRGQTLPEDVFPANVKQHYTKYS